MTEDNVEPQIPNDMISQMFDIAVKAMEDTRADPKVMEFLLGVGPEGLANIMTTAVRLKTFEALAMSFITSSLKKDRPEIVEVLRSSLELGEIVAAQVLTAFGMMPLEDVTRLYPSVAGLGMSQTPDSEMSEELVASKNGMVEALKQFEESMRGKMPIGKQQLN